VSVEEDQLSADDCYRCGYDLRGIANDRACPECGLLAERSRRVSDELHDTRPRWLSRLSRGVWLILLALMLLIVFSIVMDPLANWLFDWRSVASSPSIAFMIHYWPLLGPAIAAGVFLLGVSMLAAREQYGPADRADRLRRGLLRILAVGPLLGVVAQGLVIQWVLPPRRIWGWDRALRPESSPIWFGVLAACVPLPALLFYQLRSLAKRARSAHLAEHCAIVGIGMSAAVSYAAAMLITFQFGEQWGLATTWATRSSVSLALLLVCAVSALLFVLWSGYLLIEFAIAFHSAARQLRRKWKRDDWAMAG